MFVAIIVPAAMYRLLALTACVAYTTSSASHTAAAYADLYGELSLPVRETGLQGPVVYRTAFLTYYGLQALLNFLCCVVVAHRLWLQTAEDDRPWFNAHERRMFAARPSRRNLLGSPSSNSGRSTAADTKNGTSMV